MANETYGTKAPVILDLSGVKGAAGGGGSGSAVMSEIQVDPQTASSISVGNRTAWVVETNVKDESNVGIADSFNYTVYLKKSVTGNADPVIIHNPLVQIADSADFNPVYVPANTLIFTDTNNTRVCMRKPTSWLDILETDSSAEWEIWVRRVQVSAAE